MVINFSKFKDIPAGTLMLKRRKIDIEQNFKFTPNCQKCKSEYIKFDIKLLHQKGSSIKLYCIFYFKIYRYCYQCLLQLAFWLQFVNLHLFCQCICCDKIILSGCCVNDERILCNTRVWFLNNVMTVITSTYTLKQAKKKKKNGINQTTRFSVFNSTMVTSNKTYVYAPMHAG